MGTLGTELVVGAPEGTPAASSTQDTTQLKITDDKLETIIENGNGREEENNIVTSDDEYYSDSDNQDDEVADKTVLRDSPGTTPPDGITVLTEALTDTSRNVPDHDPKFVSTPKKNDRENVKANTWR